MTYKILWVSDSPWNNSAYAKVSRYICDYIASYYSHDFQVVYLPIIDPTEGVIQYKNIKVLPKARNSREVTAWYLKELCDLAIILKDVYAIPGINNEAILWVAYSPVCEGMISPVYKILTATATKVWQPSKWNYELCKAEGMDVDYVPHGVDTLVYKPMLERIDELKKKYLLDKFDFTIGIIAMNRIRKMIPNMLEGIKIFMENNPDIKVGIYLHTSILPLGMEFDGWNLDNIIKSLNLGSNIVIIDQVLYRAGLPEEQMAEIYNALDVVLICSLEGFGLPVIEAQACGTPVIGLDMGGTKDHNLLPELNVRSKGKFWIHTGSWFPIPDEEDIAKKLEIVLTKYDKEKYAYKLYEEIDKRYNWSKIIKEYVIPAIYRVLEKTFPKPRGKGVSIAWITPWKVRCGIAYYSEKVVNCINPKRYKVHILVLPRFGNMYPDHIQYFVRKLKEINPKIVVIQHEYALYRPILSGMEVDLLSTIKRELPNTKVIVTMHNSGHKVIDARILALADKVICKSQVILSKLPFRSEKTIIIPHGAEVKDIPKEEARKRLGIPMDRKMILIFGFIDERKGIDIALRIFEKVKERVKNVDLYIVGGWHVDIKTEYMKKIEEMAKKVGAIMTGYVPDELVDYYFAACDIVLDTRLFETSSLVIPRGIAYCKPVVTFAFPELLQYPVIACKSDDEMVEVLVRLLTDERFYNDVVSKISKIAKNIRWENTAAQYEKVFDELLKS